MGITYRGPPPQTFRFCLGQAHTDGQSSEAHAAGGLGRAAAFERALGPALGAKPQQAERGKMALLGITHVHTHMPTTSTALSTHVAPHRQGFQPHTPAHTCTLTQSCSPPTCRWARAGAKGPHVPVSTSLPASSCYPSLHAYTSQWARARACTLALVGRVWLHAKHASLSVGE